MGFSVARNAEFLVFYDWESCRVIRKIDIAAKRLYWNEVGSLVAIVTAEDFYVLAYNKAYVQENIERFETDAGDEQAFTLLFEVSINNRHSGVAKGDRRPMTA